MQHITKDQATAALRRILLKLVDATDGFTPETGLTVSAGELKLSKNGAAPANHAGTLTEIGNGQYYYEATAAEVDTVGFLSIEVIITGVRRSTFAVQVVAAAALTVAEIADGIMTRATSNWEASAPAKSLGTAVMKAVHKTIDNDGTLDIYKSDGVTPHASQPITTDTANAPIDSIGGATAA